MAASDSLNPQLFHGTGHWFKPGDVIHPGYDGSYFETPGAYATTSARIAKNASMRKRQTEESSDFSQRSLFTPYFEVEHLTEHSDPENLLTGNSNRKTYRRDPVGLRVKGVGGYSYYNDRPMWSL